MCIIFAKKMFEKSVLSKNSTQLCITFDLTIEIYDPLFYKY